MVGLNDYQINVKGKSKIYHVNLLKRISCSERAGSQWLELPAEVGYALLDMVSLALIDDDSNSPEDAADDNDLLDISSYRTGETKGNTSFSRTLSSDQLVQACDLVGEFQQVFTDTSGETNLIHHKIKLTTD